MRYTSGSSFAQIVAASRQPNLLWTHITRLQLSERFFFLRHRVFSFRMSCRQELSASRSPGLSGRIKLRDFRRPEIQNLKTYVQHIWRPEFGKLDLCKCGEAGNLGAANLEVWTSQLERKV